jgi:hypothetical protein
MPRTFTRSPGTSKVTVRDTPPARQPRVGPGGGNSAPPELVDSDRRTKVDELPDGGANAARHTGDQARHSGEGVDKKRDR